MLAAAWSVDSGTAPGTPAAPSANPPTSSPVAASRPSPAVSASVPDKRPALSASNTIVPTVQPAVEGAPVIEVGMTGTYSGVVHNLTAGISADFKIAVTETKGTIYALRGGQAASSSAAAHYARHNKWLP